MAFDHRRRGHPKKNPYSYLPFLLDFLCALPFTQFVEKLYIGVLERILTKNTILMVRGGGGQRSMVKDQTFALFDFETLPLAKQV